MKKFCILLCTVATAITILVDEPKGNVAYAATDPINATELDNPTANTEKFKAEFAYEMAKITAKIVSAPTTNVETFRVEFAYATAQLTAKAMPIIPDSQRSNFAYEMALITTKIISDPYLDIQKAKAEFAYESAQLTSRIITNADKIAISGTKEQIGYVPDKVNNNQKPMLLRNNADIEPKATDKVGNIEPDRKASVSKDYITLETYTDLIDELTHVSDRSNRLDNKVNVDGEIRLHYAFNSGPGQWGEDSSGLRVRLGLDTEINKDWRAYGMLEGKKNIANYDNEFTLSRLYVAGKLGESMLWAGSFGALMAEGNIYDSGFDGLRVDFGEPVKYTLSYGKTDSTKETFVATARYNSFDYNLEAGAYHYQRDDGTHARNTIRALGGNYNFSNFGIGAMVLNSSLKDSNGDNNGYVLSLNYGDLKTWRLGTYGIFAKYYDQPRGTYIEHGMNGAGGRMQGFKGFGLGTNYTIAENFIAGIEYYALKDKVSGEKGETWWSHLTHYF